MGQQHYSPGQSEATERREVPPWVTAKRPNTALKGHYKIFVLPTVGSFRPFRAFGVVFVSYPGRRCALPWAMLLKPVGLGIARVAPKRPLFQNSLSTK